MWILHIILFNLTAVFVLELPLGFLAGARGWRKFISLALANIITNPLVVITRLSMVIYFPSAEQIVIVIMEILAVWAEGYMFRRFEIFPRRYAYVISFILNFVSFAAGELII